MAFTYLPFHTAACHGSQDVVRLLLEHGASVQFHGALGDEPQFYEWKHPPPKEWSSGFLYTNLRYTDSKNPLLELVVRKGPSWWTIMSSLQVNRM